MQTKSSRLWPFPLALGACLLWVVTSSLSLAGHAFDDEYTDCPAATRLDAVTGLTVTRTEESDVFRISWDDLDPWTLKDSHSFNTLKLSVSIDKAGTGIHDPVNLSLDENGHVFGDVPLGQELTASVALTDRGHVISDIAKVDFISGMPAPSFSTSIKAADGLGGERPVFTAGNQEGKFFYLGFNHLFDNWHAVTPRSDTLETRNRTHPTILRIGLEHGMEELDTDKAGFAHYRISIEDSQGDLLGFQAASIDAAGIYNHLLGTKHILLGQRTEVIEAGHLEITRNGESTFLDKVNLRLSASVNRGGAVDPSYAIPFGRFKSYPEFVTPLSKGNFRYGLSYAKHVTWGREVFTPNYPAEDSLFADTPTEFFDFPQDTFAGGGNFTIRAWAEDENLQRIGPRTAITINVHKGNLKPSKHLGYTVNGERAWPVEEDIEGLMLQPYRIVLQDEHSLLTFPLDSKPQAEEDIGRKPRGPFTNAVQESEVLSG